MTCWLGSEFDPIRPASALGSSRSIWAPLVPCLAILIGLYLLRSAWAAILLYHLGIVLFMVFDPATNVASALRGGWNSGVAVASALAAGMGGVAVYFLAPALFPDLGQFAARLTEFGLSGASFWLFLAYYGAVHPAIEETYWRGYLATN